jgi:cobalt-zinc-cadmium efflux system membrane fusion protein
MRHAWVFLTAAGLLAGATVLIWPYLDEAAPRPSAPVPVAAPDAVAQPPAPVRDAALIRASPDLLKTLTIATLVEGEVREPLRVPGRVSVVEEFARLARIGAKVTGRIIQIDAVIGQEVARGQQLAMLNSAEFSDLQRLFLKALARKELYEVVVERGHMLFDAGVIPEMELRRRVSELLLAETEYRATAAQLQVIGMTNEALARLGNERKIQPLVPVVASIAGTVIDRNVTVGQVVQPADVIFVVSDLARLWIVAEVPEAQAEWLRTGQAVEATIPALGDRLVQGPLVFIGPKVHPVTRTVTVRMEVDNPDGSIKPEMLATMLIAGRAIRLPLLPAQAVVRDGERDVVFMPAGNGQFRMRTVTLGREIGGMRPVLTGLTAGDQVVTDGSFHLNAERLRQELAR